MIDSSHYLVLHNIFVFVHSHEFSYKFLEVLPVSSSKEVLRQALIEELIDELSDPLVGNSLSMEPLIQRSFLSSRLSLLVKHLLLLVNPSFGKRTTLVQIVVVVEGSGICDQGS